MRLQIGAEEVAPSPLGDEEEVVVLLRIEDGFDAPEGMPALDDLDVPDIDLNQLDDLESTIQLITEAGMAG